MSFQLKPRDAVKPAERYTSTPTGLNGKTLDPVIFILKGIDQDIQFRVRKYQRLAPGPTGEELLWNIGAARIEGWEGIVDEAGAPVPFNNDTLGQLLNDADAMDYVFDIASHTLAQLFPQLVITPPVVGESGPAPTGNPQPPMTAPPLASNSETTLPLSPDSASEAPSKES